MANTVKIKHKATAGSSPPSLEPGELAINTADGKLFWENVSGVVEGTVLKPNLGDLADVSDTVPSPNTSVYVLANVPGVGWSSQGAIGSVSLGSQPLGGWPSGSIGESLDGKASTSHASTHATGNSDAIAPSDIGAAPAASPTFTGDVTIPDKIAHAGDNSAIRFPADDTVTIETAGVERVRVDSSGRVGIGATPSSWNTSFDDLVVGSGGTNHGISIHSTGQGTLAFGDTATTGVDAYRGFVAYLHSTDSLILGSNGATRVTIASNGNVTFVGFITVAGMTATGQILADDNVAANSVVYSFDGDENCGIGRGGADTLTFVTAGAERIRVRSDGNVGIGASGGTNAGLWVQPTLSSTAGRHGIYTRVVATAASTSSVYAVTAFADVQANGSPDNTVCFFAVRPSIATGASVDKSVGLLVDSNFSTATKNYGLQLQVPYGADNYCIYADGTAPSYFAGNVGIGESNPSTTLHLASNTGRASPTPTEIRIASTASGSDWSTTDPWGRIGFYSADTSGNGPATQVAIDAVMDAAGGATSDLVFRFWNGISLAEQVRFSRTGVVTVSAGSGSAGSYLPAVVFSGDPNTGIQQVGGADTFSIVTGGNERVRVDAAGRLIAGSPAIGSEALSTADDIVVGNTGGETGMTIRSASSGAGTIAFADAGSGNGRFAGYIQYSHAIDALVLATSSTERMRVKSTGAVRFTPLAADPASGEAGDVYYNSTTNKLRVHNGTSWIDLN